MLQLWGLVVDTAAVMVESMNELMRPIRAAAEPIVATGRLDDRLSGLLAAGLALVDGGLYFARELGNVGNRIADPNDVTGHEAFVNKLHLDDLVDTGHPGWDAVCVGQAVLLAERVLRAAATLTSLHIDVAVTVDPGGSEPCPTYPSSTFRFYGRRGDPGWLVDDLESYPQPVVLLRTRPPLRRAAAELDGVGQAQRRGEPEQDVVKA